MVCRYCGPNELTPNTERLNDHHYLATHDIGVRVFKGDSTDKSINVIEVVTGEGGWALCVARNEDGSVRLCECQQTYASFIDWSDEWRVEKL